jgi:TPP-dependent pyruvate/acetoin dehydrogenase alpha subunit
LNDAAISGHDASLIDGRHISCVDNKKAKPAFVCIQASITSTKPIAAGKAWIKRILRLTVAAP